MSVPHTESLIVSVDCTLLIDDRVTDGPQLSTFHR